MKSIFIIFFVLFLATTGCMSVTYKAPNTSENLNTKPDFEDYVPGYFWGISKPRLPEPKNVCQKQEPIQVRKGKSVEDSLLAFFTLGIYWPTTMQVWCSP